MADAGLEQWCARAVELGADEAKLIDPSQVVTADWVRMKCLFGCDGPGDYRCCPPLSPTPDQTRRLLGEYERAILLRVGPFHGEDESDDRGLRLNDAATDLERELFLDGFYRAWTMGSGPCDRCETCNLDEPCRIPERARPSMEGCGVDVFATVRDAGWEMEVVRDRDDEYRFFALVLVD